MKCHELMDRQLALEPMRVFVLGRRTGKAFTAQLTSYSTTVCTNTNKKYKYNELNRVHAVISADLKNSTTRNSNRRPADPKVCVLPTTPQRLTG